MYGDVMKTDRQLKDLWCQFFEKHGFKRIPGYSIIPENDPTVLFTTAGMHPLVPYLLGEPHPAGNRIFDVQRCIRTNDIDEVGDNSHLTCFEMLGNWTLGTCDKAEMIRLSYEFLTSPEYLGIPKERLAVSVFAGDDVAPRDEVAAAAWRDCGIQEVFFLPKENNWWALGGGVGPCGPDSEMFYDTGKPKCCETCSPACDCGKYLEIWNDVFMQYKVEKAGDKAIKLANPNIDTGMGLERTVCVLNGAKSVYDSGCLRRVIDYIEKNASIPYEQDPKSYRIIADHLRSSTFILGDARGVLPSNVGQGYILRRFIRRSVNCARKIHFDVANFSQIASIYVDEYGKDYDDIAANKQKVVEELGKEVERFAKAIEEGYREFEKVLAGIEKHKAFAATKGESVENVISGAAAFRLYDTFGFPVELTVEVASERGYQVDLQGFETKFQEHQEKSRQATAGQFKGGLADASAESAKLHTATHIMLAGLRKMFGDDVYQKGSNITPERLRFDFNLDHKMTAEELKTLENFVNDVIQSSIPVVCQVMTYDEAKNCGALGIFTNKYGDSVKVYSIEGVSKEICGGPHASNTAELHHFKIMKEESSSSGIRRIKAVLD